MDEGLQACSHLYRASTKHKLITWVQKLKRMKKLYIRKEKLCIRKEKWHLKAIGFGKKNSCVWKLIA